MSGKTHRDAHYVTVDSALSAKLLSACRHGDIDACHEALVALHQQYPDSIHPNGSPVPTQAYRPLCDLIGHGFTIAASMNHVDLLEYMVSSTFATVLRDGICSNPQLFPPFAATQSHELVCCTDSIRFVAYAVLSCIDQLAMHSLEFLLETKMLWDFEASLCVSLAMRRATAGVGSQSSSTSTTSASVSPAAFHAILVSLVKSYDFLVDDIRNFHHKKSFQSKIGDDMDRVKSLQASLLFEIASDMD